jgi:hypothetical protein
LLKLKSKQRLNCLKKRNKYHGRDKSTNTGFSYIEPWHE